MEDEVAVRKGTGMKKIIKEKYSALDVICIILFLLTPLISGILFCAMDGKTLADIYIPLGGWSDEITYYKQIEGMVSHGSPIGYSGYNQSRAAFGPYAYWGVLPLIPYAIWGHIFGWTYTSPIYANIFFCVLAFALIYVFLRPSKKCCLAFSVFWITFEYLNRHVLSGVVEASVVQQLVLVIVLGELLLSDKVGAKQMLSQKKENVIVIICTALVFFMTVVRPYYAVFYLIPFWSVAKRRNKVGIVAVPVAAFLSLVVFFLYKEYFCAAYFGEVILTDVIMGPDGIRGILRHIVSDIVEIAKYIWYGIRYYDAVGWYYLLLLAELASMLGVCIYRGCRKKSIPKIYVVSLIGSTLILLSMMILYDLPTGGRHILAILVVNALILLVESHEGFCILLGGIGVLCTIFAGRREPIPYIEPEYAQWMEELEVLFAEKVQLTDELSYDNVVTLPVSDTSATDMQKKVGVYYGLMYAMPAGMGVSGDEERIYDNPENVKAKYILVHPDGMVRQKLEAMGMVCIMEQEEFALYARE